MSDLIVIGGGLAGSEAAYQAAKRGISVAIYEMRPARQTEAHKTGLLGELVCSNSLRSESLSNGHGLLKRELSTAGSLVMEAAMASQIPGGSALAVDRERFAAYITGRLTMHPLITIIRSELDCVPDGVCILATGPLTSPALSGWLMDTLGAGHLYFYDAIAPIIDATSIDYEKVFFASRYGKGGDDYLNCPMNEREYGIFYDALVEADKVMARDFEDERVFEGCMPLEAMALRGRDTIRFGPLKPVGLRDPRTGKEPFAVVQLRPENEDKTAFNMVGFQTRLRQPGQKMVFGLIPGLEKAEFLRYGSVHRNTFIDSPKVLNDDLTLKINRKADGMKNGSENGSEYEMQVGKTSGNIYVAGQLSGVEGYLESTAMGLLAGIYASRRLRGLPLVTPSENTCHGALVRYITTGKSGSFQPSNINFGILPPLEKNIRDKAKKKLAMAERALRQWEMFVERAD
ncbi:MAG: methylenetetrahydrofolate--tRNA-(uracil(54)-C(5))-methyltransferase (FADH(2)-oxidizing) TrmFO [Nitrospirae bacterium]|nr:methylenetetrahydrofolate--tRNA-(uracil(54)-C(5))-methyltransferase (FADH(2)-oxidizing) TrmFO [Nitrospirota bacterium]